jgi:hypothetical protein
MKITWVFDSEKFEIWTNYSDGNIYLKCNVCNTTIKEYHSGVNLGRIIEDAEEHQSHGGIRNEL